MKTLLGETIDGLNDKKDNTLVLKDRDKIDQIIQYPEKDVMIVYHFFWKGGQIFMDKFCYFKEDRLMYSFEFEYSDTLLLSASYIDYNNGDIFTSPRAFPDKEADYYLESPLPDINSMVMEIIKRLYL